MHDKAVEAVANQMLYVAIDCSAPPPDGRGLS
jgi:hypothetical protein